jgi:metal-responsive CopG/Arc/MetJ family transcriptional regulator
MQGIDAVQEQITISVPSEIKVALDELIRGGGASPDELVGEAIRQYIFARRFRTLRERMASNARTQGIVTDQDVFDRVS